MQLDIRACAGPITGAIVLRQIGCSLTRPAQKKRRAFNMFHASLVFSGRSSSCSSGPRVTRGRSAKKYQNVKKIGTPSSPVQIAIPVVDCLVPLASHKRQPSLDFAYPSVSLQIPHSGPYAPGMQRPLGYDAFPSRQAVGGMHRYSATLLPRFTVSAVSASSCRRFLVPMSRLLLRGDQKPEERGACSCL